MILREVALHDYKLDPLQIKSFRRDKFIDSLFKFKDTDEIFALFFFFKRFFLSFFILFLCWFHFKLKLQTLISSLNFQLLGAVDIWQNTIFQYPENLLPKFSWDPSYGTLVHNWLWFRRFLYKLQMHGYGSAILLSHSWGGT